MWGVREERTHLIGQIVYSVEEFALFVFEPPGLLLQFNERTLVELRLRFALGIWVSAKHQRGRNHDSLCLRAAQYLPSVGEELRACRLSAPQHSEHTAWCWPRGL